MASSRYFVVQGEISPSLATAALRGIQKTIRFPATLEVNGKEIRIWSLNGPVNVAPSEDAIALLMNEHNRKFLQIAVDLSERIVEQEDMILANVMALASSGNALIVGPAGEGKTKTIELLFTMLSNHLRTFAHEFGKYSNESNLGVRPIVEERQDGDAVIKTMYQKLVDGIKNADLVRLGEINRAVAFFGELKSLLSSRTWKSSEPTPVIAVFMDVNPPEEDEETVPLPRIIKDRCIIAVVRSVWSENPEAIVEQQEKDLDNVPLHNLTREEIINASERIKAMPLTKGYKEAMVKMMRASSEEKIFKKSLTGRTWFFVTDTARVFAFLRGANAVKKIDLIHAARLTLPGRASNYFDEYEAAEQTLESIIYQL